MVKTALLFAGQGSQFVGMGQDLAKTHSTAQKFFSQADEVLGYSLSEICFSGPEEDLVRTEHAQPAIYLLGWLYLVKRGHRYPRRGSLQFHFPHKVSIPHACALPHQPVDGN